MENVIENEKGDTEVRAVLVLFFVMLTLHLEENYICCLETGDGENTKDDDDA